MNPNRQRVYKTEAIIIKRVKLGEADRIITFYTPHLGKLQGVAKGVRWLEAGAATDATLRLFESRLLTLTGYRPELRRCVFCQQTLAPAAAFFSPAGGGVVCAECRGGQAWLRPVSLPALKVLRFM